MTIRTSAALVLACALAGSLTACAGTAPEHEAMAHDHAAALHGPMLAIAHVMPTQGNAARGTVRFEQIEVGVRITGEISGLRPNSLHAFHLHEFGDCSAPDGTSAGGHYNPDGHQHAGPDAPAHHAGDFGNLQADASGTARVDLVSDDLSVSGPRNPVLGRSVVIHAQADDLVTQPTGNAGGRIGCGIVGVAKPDAAK